MKHMNRKLMGFILMVLVGMVFAACAPVLPEAVATSTPSAPQAQPTPQPADTATSVPPTPANSVATKAPAQPTLEAPAPVIEAQKDLAKRQNLPLDQIKIVSVEKVEWPNGCLGISKPGIMCTDVIVPGYRVTLEANGKTYEYRTDMSGKQVVLSEGVNGPVSEGASDGTEIPVDLTNLPAAVIKARESLSQKTQAKPEEIQVLKIESVEWPNGCLGVEAPGRMCTQVITPGYRVIFSYQDKQYEFHTDEGGGSVMEAAAPLPQTSEKVITWQQIENNVCGRVEIGVKTVAFGQCNGSLKEAPLPISRLKDLRTLLSTYAPFKATTPSGDIFLNGNGTKEATQAEQRSVAEWAKLVKMEAESERGGAAWGLAFGWHREGGIAGFCDDMGVYLSGWAQPSSCKGSQPAGKPSFRLNADQLSQLYTWVDQYQNFDYEMKDPAGAADAMTVRLTFSGAGAEKASPEVQAQIAKFASDLYALAPK